MVEYQLRYNDGEIDHTDNWELAWEIFQQSSTMKLSFPNPGLKFIPLHIRNLRFRLVPVVDLLTWSDECRFKLNLLLPNWTDKYLLDQSLVILQLIANFSYMNWQRMKMTEDEYLVWNSQKDDGHAAACVKGAWPVEQFKALMEQELVQLNKK